MTYTCPKGHPLKMGDDPVVGTDASGYVYLVTMTCEVCGTLFSRRDNGVIVSVSPAAITQYD